MRNIKRANFHCAWISYILLFAASLANASVDFPKTSSVNPLPSRSPHAADRILVRYKEPINVAQRSALNRTLNTHVVSESRAVNGLQVVRIASATRLEATLKAYRRNPAVLYAEPDYRLEFFATTPSDARFTEQWSLKNTGENGRLAGADINATRAWDITTGNSTVYVGIVDSGVDYTHPDLAANMWANPGEIPNNGIDDDGNGYIDDVHGINGVSGYGDPMDYFGHGTHVAGTVAAHGNNADGVTGVSWNAKIIACSLLDGDTFEAFVSGAVKCLDYLYDLKTRFGIDIIATNNSWGWMGQPSQSLRDAILRQQNAGILFVAAAGNNGAELAYNTHYPASYELPNVISVAATDDSDHKAGFSNFGRSSVHIAAPGVDILSTVPGNNFEAHSGTSMAAPHVVGVLALLKAQNSARNWIKLKNLLLAGGQVVDTLNLTITGRRLLAAGENGTGSLTCLNQSVNHRLAPRAKYLTLDYGPAQQVDLSVLSIQCEHAGETPTVAVAGSDAIITLVDDGTQGDPIAGDGEFHAQLSIPANQSAPITLAFPGGDIVQVSFVPNYQAAETVAYEWRDLSVNANQVLMGDDTIHVLKLPFDLRLGTATSAVTYFAISDNGYVIPTNDEEMAYQAPSMWFNFGLFGTMLAPFWDDLYPMKNAGIYWAVRGVAPEREFIVEWRNFVHFSSYVESQFSGEAAPLDPVTFQMVLFESRADIIFNYADVSLGDPELDNGKSATVGVNYGYGQGSDLDTLERPLSNGLSLLWEMGPVPPAESDSAASSGGGGVVEPVTALALVLLVAFGIRTRQKPIQRILRLHLHVPGGAND